VSISSNNSASRSPETRRLWHTEPAEDVLAALESGPAGLSKEEAEARKERFGPNRLPEAARQSALWRFILQFNNVLIYVLLGAAVLATAIGHVVDAAVILAVVIVNAVIGFVQEGRAEKALEAIRSMIDPHASVIRDGRRIVVPAEDIVPGDIVLLEPGDRVPADLRLVRARNLRIDEAALTGESIPVEKDPRPLSTDAPLGDRRSMAFSGTLVTTGGGNGVAVATGASSELGRISTLVGTVETLTTPLLRQMSDFGQRLTALILAGCAAVFAFAVFVRDYPWADAFMVVIGLAVSAIPEGLPAVMTITLAIGVQRMAARNAIIRSLPAVETLGSVSVICSDKTGTLTRNEMMVRTVLTAEGAFEVSGAGYHPDGDVRLNGDPIQVATYDTLAEAGRAAILCNDAELHQREGDWKVHGDPMEGALVSLGMKLGYDATLLRKQLPRTDEIPFDTEHKFMATLHHSHEDGVTFALIKGAPERVLAMCSKQWGKAGNEPLDAAFWHAQTDAVARKGQRMLAIAYKALPHGHHDLNFSDVEHDAILIGLLGLIDPPRDEVLTAIHECRNAGIDVKMITGDHVATAEAIARELDLSEEPVALTGTELDAVGDADLKSLVRKVTVFARTTPAHKLRLVEALQAGDAVTAMTGDGVNDAPALKRADVGVAMGKKGTDAAKEAAAVVLADDNFASIVAAVREGRTVYDNLLKVIAWTLPTNGGEAAAVIGAIAFGLMLPITPIQILWINMVTAVALGLTLAFEPTEPGTMRRPPRDPGASILSGKLLWRTAFVSLLFVTGAFGIFFHALERGETVELARTLVVNTIVVMEIFYLFSVRYVYGGSITWRGMLGTPAILIGVSVVVAAQLAFTYLPILQNIFATEPVSPSDGLLVVLIGVALLLIVEAEKALSSALIRVAKHGRRTPPHET
jgi:magnesium-transporting ATPase (P-type)